MSIMRLEIEVGGKSRRAFDTLSHAKKFRVDSLSVEERKKGYLRKGRTRLYVYFRKMTRAAWRTDGRQVRLEAERTAESCK